MIFVPFALLGIAWCLAMPVFSGPDENVRAVTDTVFFHGDLLPTLTADPGPGDPNQFETAFVTFRGINGPYWPRGGIGCYVDNPTRSAGCDQVSLVGSDSKTNHAWDYVSHEPPLPTVLTGLPIALAPDRDGFYLSRILTALLSSALFSCACALAFVRNRPAILVMVVTGATPLVIAEWGVLGTQWLETGLATLLATCIAVAATSTEVDGQLSWLLWGSMALLALSRPDSLIYAAAGLVALYFLVGRRAFVKMWSVPGANVSMLATGGAFVLSAFWALRVEAPVNPASIRRLYPAGLGADAHLSNDLSGIVERLPDVWFEAVGGQGWTPGEYRGPLVIFAVWLVVVLMVVAGALLSQRGTPRSMTAMMGTIFLAVPIAFACYYEPKVGTEPNGEFWLGRYSLASLEMMLVIAAVGWERWSNRRWLTRLRFLAVVFGLLQAVYFFCVLHRYAVGTLGSLNPLNWATGWNPPLGSLALLLIATTAITLGYTTLFTWLGLAGGGSESADPLLSLAPTRSRSDSER